jgi:TRAP transporter TAXI family solute receptor
VFALALGLSVAGDASAQTPKKGAPLSHEAARAKANENLVMLLGGPAGGVFMQLAQDIAVATNEKDELRVLPLAGDGAVGNVRDVLVLRGVDLGITSVQALNLAKVSGEYGPNLEKRLAYITPLTVGPFHVLARGELKSVKDLHGKKVNLAQKGSGTSNYVPKIFKALGIEVVPIYVTHTEGIQLMRNGEIDATLCVCPLPVPAYAAIKPELGFRFLEVPYIDKLEEAFLPGSLTNEHYPNLIAPGATVKTVANTTVLVAFNWAPGTDRYRKIEKFVNAFFGNMDKLRQRPPPAIWKDVNISANIRGWPRFPAAQQWLDQQAAEAAAKAKAKVKAQAASPPPPTLPQAPKGGVTEHDAATQERLFQEFLEWSKKQQRR